MNPPIKKNNMTLLACMYMAGLVRPTLIPSREGKSEYIKLQAAPIPMKKESLEAQAIKIQKAEEKRRVRAAKRRI